MPLRKWSISLVAANKVSQLIETNFSLLPYNRYASNQLRPPDPIQNPAFWLTPKPFMFYYKKPQRKQSKMAVFNSGSGQRKGRSDDALDGRQQWVRERSSLKKGK